MQHATNAVAVQPDLEARIETRLPFPKLKAGHHPNIHAVHLPNVSLLFKGEQLLKPTPD